MDEHDDNDDLSQIRQYATTGSGEAFARVMARHVDMVYSACRRRLGDVAAAEDATQAAFVSLARKAHTLTRGTVVAGWLYRAARYEAAQLARQEAVRRRHEMAAAEQRSTSTASATGAEAAHVEQLAASEWVDRALERLNDAERHAIVPRYFSGRSFAEVAREMRTTEEAARKRVSRGLERLRALLLQRSGTASAAAVPLAAVERVLAASMHAAPPYLTTTTLHAIAASTSTAAAGHAAAATKGALITMALTKAKALAGAAAAVLRCGGGAAAH